MEYERSLYNILRKRGDSGIGRKVGDNFLSSPDFKCLFRKDILTVVGLSYKIMKECHRALTVRLG